MAGLFGLKVNLHMISVCCFSFRLMCYSFYAFDCLIDIAYLTPIKLANAEATAASLSVSDESVAIISTTVCKDIPYLLYLKRFKITFNLLHVLAAYKSLIPTVSRIME